MGAERPRSCLQTCRSNRGCSVSARSVTGAQGVPRGWPRAVIRAETGENSGVIAFYFRNVAVPVRPEAGDAEFNGPALLRNEKALDL